MSTPWFDPSTFNARKEVAMKNSNCFDLALQEIDNYVSNDLYIHPNGDVKTTKICFTLQSAIPAIFKNLGQILLDTNDNAYWEYVKEWFDTKLKSRYFDVKVRAWVDRDMSINFKKERY